MAQSSSKHKIKKKSKCRNLALVLLFLAIVAVAARQLHLAAWVEHEIYQATHFNSHWRPPPPRPKVKRPKGSKVSVLEKLFETAGQAPPPHVIAVHEEKEHPPKQPSSKPPPQPQQQQPEARPPKEQQKQSGKYLTFGRFSASWNELIFQFVSALQHAVILNRTLIVPSEVQWEHWTGLLDNDILDIWNLTQLNARYSIDWGTQHTLARNISSECRPRHIDVLARREQYQHCPILDMGGTKGLLFCGQHVRFCGRDAKEERVAHDIFPYLQLSTRFQAFLPPQRYPIGVHSCTMGGFEDPSSYPLTDCITQVRKATNSHISLGLHATHNTNTTLAEYCSLWNNLEKQLSPNYRSIYQQQRQENKTAFFLASDSSYDWSQIFARHEFVSMDIKPIMNQLLVKYDQAVQSKVALDKLSPYFQSLLQPNQRGLYERRIRALASSIVNTYALVKQDYFVSCPSSTVALTVCLLRGVYKKFDSNMCWMLIHANTKYAVFPKYLIQEKGGPDN